jgi:hypothetical protein
MNNQHPITPPPELVKRLLLEILNKSSMPESDLDVVYDNMQNFAKKLYAAGADAELEACVEWLGDAPVVWKNDDEIHPGFYLRMARRPKSTIKKQAIKTLEKLSKDEYPCSYQDDADWTIIRKALETLPDDVE